MRSVELLSDAFDRIRTGTHDVVADLTPDQLAARLDNRANSIAWLIWHLTRVQDDHVADAAGTEQAWTAEGWSDRFELPFDRSATGYGHSSRDVAQVQVKSGELLAEYYDAVHDRTLRFLEGLHDRDLDRIVDESWEPPVSLGVRLVSIVDDSAQHIGQAAFIRGVLQRRKQR
ncbi:mycothiol transferase [Phytoactinopolyspora mesophila]|uniref:DUF664 domain-containing protein n=1 Tax=Phytoactinopolyspora mesophila TaxID=2650750 RepID=A0A7K3M6Q1_9ACTN|nr:DinB family protein [Phytoactinopolyspora mesophila]NDL58989.1 DUF664 domain-containing protein [Phytoactinopolyspora mesophila]